MNSFDPLVGDEAWASTSDEWLRPASGVRSPDGREQPLPAAAEAAAVDDLALDLLELALDLTGLVDPTPISDGTSALLALGRGRWFDAAASGAGMLPWIGDLAKAGKLPRYLRIIERTVEWVERSERAARRLLPGLERLDQVLHWLPAGGDLRVRQMQTRIRTLLVRQTSGRRARPSLPDIRRRFRFRTVVRGEVTLRCASGRLGVPGRVQTRRNRAAQRSVNRRAPGDDAGHLIGTQFGAPGDARNLGAQNWIANRGAGTFHALERNWADQLRQGHGLHVFVADFTRRGELRPYKRRVRWEQTAPDGTVTRGESTFMNAHTPESRLRQEIPSLRQDGELIENERALEHWWSSWKEHGR